jgi:monoamine oxidase
VTTLSRRQFLMRMSAAGGSAALFQGLLGLGLMPGKAQASIADWALAPAQKPVRVVILGGGLSGLVAAYELRQRGYECELLEASHRVGGRNFTVRSGALIDELGNRQRCEFDAQPDLYFNAGPARIPAHHQRILGYCKELGVPLEVFVNYNSQAWVHDSKLMGGNRVRLREYISDARGFMAEMMTKNLSDADVDQAMTAGDAERLRDFLRRYGDLSVEGKYLGSSRAGYARGGVMAVGEKKSTLKFPELLASDFWKMGMNFSEGETMAAPLMQMVGGNDAIVKALEKRVAPIIKRDAQVVGIQVQDDGVRVRYLQAGREHSTSADYCLNCIPGPILSGISNNFSDAYRAALTALPRGHLVKAAFQTRTRFWEDEMIYGGISWTSGDIQQMLYPSGTFHGLKGVVVGAYVFKSDAALRFTHMPYQQRLAEVVKQADQIHPGFSNQVETGVTVAWRNMNHMLGCAAHVAGPESEDVLRTLKQPAGRHIMMGDQTTHHSGWQEGAVGSAHAALSLLNSMEAARV